VHGRRVAVADGPRNEAPSGDREGTRTRRAPDERSRKASSEADRNREDGGPDPRHGRGKPQGGRNPGAPGRPWPAGKPSGGRPNRREEQTPGAKPRPLSRKGRAGRCSEALRDHRAWSRVEPSAGGESRVERRGRFRPCQALKGGTPGAYPVETHRGVRWRSKASRHRGSAGTQRDPGEASPGMVAAAGWVTL
jgi:hypothetical protein